MMQRYIVNVRRYSDGTQLAETHRADSWQSAILSHSWIGAEFEDLVDEEDLEKRAAKYGLYIEVSEVKK